MSQIINRPKREIETPNGHKVVVFEYITGGEMMQFQELFLENTSAADILETGAQSKSDQESAQRKRLERIEATTFLKGRRLLDKLLVVSVDGEVGASALDLKSADVDYVMEELDKYVGDDAEKKAENSSQNTPLAGEPARS